MDLWTFVAEVVLITSSGALSPGPLTFATIAEGAKRGWRAGFSAAIGHSFVELALISLIALGLSRAFSEERVQASIGLLGGISLLVYAVLQARGGLAVLRGGGDSVSLERGASRGGLYVGVIFSALNPFFLLWWATVGAKLVLDSMLLSPSNPLLGLPVLFASHVWMDYAWLTLVASLAAGGKKLRREYVAFLLLASSLIMAYFALKFLCESLPILAGSI